MAKWATTNPPKKTGQYLISSKGTVYLAKRVEYPKGNWYWNTIPGGTRTDSEVQGWQKQPEPIKY